MSAAISNRIGVIANESKSMKEFGKVFISALPKHIASLHTPGRNISFDVSMPPKPAEIDEIAGVQNTLMEVLSHSITQEAEFHAESALAAFLNKERVDSGLLKFFNGWNETHKTTSLVSAKIIMRLAADALLIPADQKSGYEKTMAHMHEVAKDDFGLGHKGHDGMFNYMTNAFGASNWVETQYKILECDEFSAFLYGIGVSGHKAPLNSSEHNESITKAMMISIASETWNGREFNFIAQYIEKKLLSINPLFAHDSAAFRNAKGYVMGHAGEVENKHGLHALAALQVFSRTRGTQFSLKHLKEVMLDYNHRVGNAFSALHRSLVLNN
jgi:hypothetical protein